MFIIYNIVFSCFAVFYLPFFLMRLMQAESKKRLLSDRFGFLPNDLLAGRTQQCVWLHAVSVGEVLAIKRMVDKLSRDVPEVTICLSVVTPTGFSVARKNMGEQARIFYLPFDISVITDRVMRQVGPDVLALVETELWPNLMRSAKKYGAQVCIVNGRISPKSFRNYYRFRFFVKPIVRMVDRAIVQTERYKRRLMRLGMRSDAIVVTGTMKYDIDLTVHESDGAQEAWKVRCGFAPDAPVFIAASTHDTEEDICVQAFKQAQKSFPHMRMVIAPRHVDRAKKIGEVVRRHRCSYRCAVPVSGDAECAAPDVFIMNTIGELARAYAYCDFVFMGGSLIPHGGQNPLEAVKYARPIISGVYYQNFPDVYRDLLRVGAVMVVADAQHLTDVLLMFAQSPSTCEEMGQAGYELLKSKRGALAKNCAAIIALLGKAE